MKRLRRIIFNALTVLSLLLCVATVVLWVRSFRHDSAFEFSVRSVRWEITSRRGSLWFDNYPQSRLESNQWHATFKESLAEDERLFDRMRTNISAADWNPDEVARARREFARARRELEESRRRYQERLSTMTRARTPYVRLMQHRHLTVAAWFSVLPLFTMIWMSRAWAKRRRQRGGTFCSVCNYDLRATPDRCPECGTVPTR
ncbi:MAG: hypothetical protein JWN40_58 [Phycisphaerales bacterium]|nr:hypothetical protein [Phycisphaerales bacterium]